VAPVRRALPFLFAAVVASSCNYTRVQVHTGRPGDKATWEVGHDVDLTRISTRGFTGQKPGFRVVHNRDEWLYVWSDARPDRPRPPPPPEIDWNTQVAIVATSMTANAKSIELTHAVRTHNGTLHVYAVEDIPGDGCTFAAPKDPPIDVAIVSGTFDEVSFWVDRDVGLSCGSRPNARVECRLMGQQGAVDKITASPGQTINCDGLKSDPGSARAITDRNWYLTQIAPGSTSKIKLSDGSKSATFAVDAYGTYVVRHEISDDEARSADMIATVEVPPPADAITIQMGWGKITSGDDPTTFPRIELLGVETPAKLGVKAPGKVCTSAEGTILPPWCRVSAVAYVTHLRLEPVEKKSYRFGVRYEDDRYQGGPMVCLRVFVKGKPPVETCDETTRKSGEVWDTGVLDQETGAFALDTVKK